MNSETAIRAANDDLVRIEVRVGDAWTAEIVSVEAFEAGAEGIEEREESGIIVLWIYAAAGAVDAVREALARSASGVELRSVEPVAPADWSEQWKRGLEAVDASPRLRVRPSFVAPSSQTDRCELVIDPGQAFGTGGHPSTRLSLAWIDAVEPRLARGWRLLDVGTGTGVLAIAALRLGAAGAVACDLDALAIEAARENAAANGVAAGLSLFRGSIDALGPASFDLVTANLLRSELVPLLGGIAGHLHEAGRAVLAGLLRGECEAVIGDARRAGMRCIDRREMADAGGEVWSALLMTR